MPRCFINAPAIFLSLTRTPQRTLYMGAVMTPLAGPGLQRFEGVDGVRNKDAVASLLEPGNGLAHATIGEVALYLGHLKRIRESQLKEKRPVLLLEDDALPVLPGMWDGPLDDTYRLAGAAYSYAVQRADGTWTPVFWDPHKIENCQLFATFFRTAGLLDNDSFERNAPNIDESLSTKFAGATAAVPRSLSIVAGSTTPCELPQKQLAASTSRHVGELAVKDRSAVQPQQAQVAKLIGKIEQRVATTRNLRGSWGAATKNCDMGQMIARHVKIVKWGTPEIWSAKPKMTWLNQKRDDSHPPDEFRGFEFVDLTVEGVEWPWAWMRTDVEPIVEKSQSSVDLNGTDLHQHPVQPASPLLSTDYALVWSTTSYVIHPRIMERLASLMSRQQDGTYKYKCVAPCKSDAALPAIVQDQMLYPRVQHFTMHPLGGDTGVRSGRSHLFPDQIVSHWSAFSQAHGNAVEAALVEIAFSVAHTGGRQLANDFRGIFWMADVPNVFLNLLEVGSYIILHVFLVFVLVYSCASVLPSTFSKRRRGLRVSYVRL